MRIIQYLLMFAALGCVIAVVWFPAHWWQLILTAVLLLIGGVGCSVARDNQLLSGRGPR